jgi:ubiquinone biosynthesis protein
VSAQRARAREIVAILSRNGLDDVVDRVARRDGSTRRPERVRLALEELGATWVKLGQILSTRQDLLPEEYLRELAKLQDDATPVPSAVIAELVEQELGEPPEQAFASFDLQPLAAASIGQAHAATLHDGTDVVVKVRRPGVVEQVEQDLEILLNLATRASRHWHVAAAYDVAALAGDFAQTLRAELDYLTEGRSAERFAANFADEPAVRIPRVFWDRTTSRVLTLERIGGLNVSDLAALDAAGVDRRALAERATRLTAAMIFEHGSFHGDPHPGNLFIEESGRIGLVDFGMVGTVDESLRQRLAAVLVAFTGRSADALTDAVLGLGVARRPVNRDALRQDIATLLDRYGGAGIGEIPLVKVLEELLGIVRRHHLQLPRDLALLLKVLVMDQGMAAELAPEFQLEPVLAPYAQRFVQQQFSPEALGPRVGQALTAALQLGVELPDQLRRLLAALDRGGLDVRLHADDLEDVVSRTERVGNRVVAALLLSALTRRPPAAPGRWFSRDGARAAGPLGAVGALGAYLAWTSRPRRR